MTAFVARQGATNSLLLVAKGQTGSLLGNVYPRPTIDSGIQAYSDPYYLANMPHGVGSHTINFPWASSYPPSNNYAGNKIGTYSDLLFGHFLVIPTTLALGSVLSAETHTVEVGNLYFTPMQIDSVTNDAGGAVTLPSLPSFPDVLPSFGSLTITVDIAAAGAASINGDLVIVGDADGGGSPQNLYVLITASGITLFPMIPEEGYTEELQWKTDVIESYAGYEQRIKIRQNPRQVLTYEVYAANSIDAASIRILLFGWMSRVFGVPIWWEQSALTAIGNPGDATISITTANADYRVGSLVFIRNLSGSFEVFEITDIAADMLTINSTLGNTYPLGQSWAMPGRNAYAKTQTTAATNLINGGKFTISFTTIDNVDLAYWDTSIWPAYQGYPVLVDFNYVEGTLQEGTDQNGIVIIDNQSGVILQQSSTDRARPRSIKTWWTNYLSDVWPIRQLAHYLGGSQGTFWLPSNREDMVLAAEITAGSSVMTIYSIGYSSYALDAEGNPMVPFSNVRMTLTDGTRLFFQIQSATTAFGDSTESITMTETISETVILQSQVVMIDFMNYMRISDDKVKFTHYHPGQSKIEFNCVGVRQ